MKIKLSREVKIGGLVLLTLAVGFWGFNFLKGVNIFAKNRTYYAIYAQVDGLGIGSPVEVNGFSIGTVTGIRLIPEKPGLILVKFRISNRDFVLPEDSEARIESSSLLGSKHVRIVLGSSTSEAAPGDTLNSGIEETLQQSVNRMLVPLKEKVENVVITVDSILTPIQAVLTPKTVNSISQSIETIPDIINNIKNVTGRIDQLVLNEKDKISHVITNIESITANLKKNNEKITSILENVDQLSDSLAKSNIKKTIQTVTDVLSKVDAIADKINKGEGTIGLLVNDRKLYDQIDSAVVNLNSLITDLEENPERYVHLSLIHINKKVTPPKEKKKDNTTSP